VTAAVLIQRIAAGGDGVGRLEDGMAVFVPRTAPGDLVEVTLTERRARFARGYPVRIATRAPVRVAPTCPHYEADRCGGCQLQHLAPAAQLDAKLAIVRETLRRIGGVDVPGLEIVAAPSPWRYRTTITLAAGSGGVLGLHPWDRPDQVFALDDCHIASTVLMNLWHRVRACRPLLPDDVTHLMLREDRDGGLHALVRGGSPPWDPAPLAASLGVPLPTLWWEPEGGAPRVLVGARTGYPATAFAQVQPGLADQVRSEAIEALGEVAGRVVWDLYGGTGDAARALAARGAQVWSVDADPSAVSWARDRASVPGAVPPRYLEGRVEEVLHRLPEATAVLLNPPRAGADKRVLAALDRAAGRTLRLAYVSCDPATLARDLTRLSRYRVTHASAYDLFPQTSHVETLVALEAV
jgi:23S rRNA (uracil1939-C5)-methyltransferase